jgi:hypothetical protein
MKVLKDFIHSFDFVRMRPDQSLLKSGLPQKGKGRVLAESGQQYAVYVFGGPQAELGLEVPAGSYKVNWISPTTGATVKQSNLNHKGGVATLNSPAYDSDIALRILAAR